MYQAWRFFLAWARLSESAICEQSDSPYFDFHDYPDSLEGHPDHFVELTCKRCGKKFII